MSVLEIANNAMTAINNYIQKNRPAILRGIGYATMVSSLGFAIKGTIDAVPMVEKKKKELEKDHLTPLETVKTVWKCYVPMIITAGTTVGLFVMSDIETAQKTATLATLYSMSEEALKEYKNEVRNQLGERKSKQIQDEVNHGLVKDKDISNQVVVVGASGKVQCYDSYSKRPFVSDVNSIRSAVNKLNHRMYSDITVSLNDLYFEIGLDPVEYGYDIGWDINKELIEISFSCVLDKDDVPTLVITFENRPGPIK